MEVATCQTCGRVVLVGSWEWKQDWLDAPHRYEDRTVVRCPQHISKESLKHTYGLRKAVRVWAEEARVRDEQRAKSSNPFIDPYPFKETDSQSTESRQAGLQQTGQSTEESRVQEEGHLGEDSQERP